MKRSLMDMAGYALSGRDGEIGQCEDFLIEDRPWVVRYLVADTGNWLFGRRVLIPLKALKTPDDTQRLINVALTRAEIEACKPISADPPVSSGLGERSYLYYGWPSAMSGASLDGVLNLSAPNTKPNRSFLRSASEMAAYSVFSDGAAFGAVSDFIIDQALWAVRYLVIAVMYDDRHKDILIPVENVTRVNWPDQCIDVILDIHAIPDYPEYRATPPAFSAEAELRLKAYLTDFKGGSSEHSAQPPQTTHSHGS